METNQTESNNNSAVAENPQVLINLQNPNISDEARANIVEKYREEYVPYYARRRMKMEPLGHLKNMIAYGSKGVLAKHEIDAVIRELKNLLDDGDSVGAGEILGQLSYVFGIIVNGKLSEEHAARDLERLYGIDNARFTILQLLECSAPYIDICGIFEALVFGKTRVMELFEDKFQYKTMVALAAASHDLPREVLEEEKVKEALLDLYKHCRGFGGIKCNINVLSKEALLSVAPVAIVDPAISTHNYFGKGIDELNELFEASGLTAEDVTSKIEFDEGVYMPDSIDQCGTGKYLLITPEGYKTWEELKNRETRVPNLEAALAEWVNASRDGELTKMVSALSNLVTTESFVGSTATPEEEVERQRRIIEAVNTLPEDQRARYIHLIAPVIANEEYDMTNVRGDVARNWFNYAVLISKVAPFNISMITGFLYRHHDIWFDDEQLDVLLGLYEPNIVASMCKWNVNFKFIKANYGVGKSFMGISQQMLNFVPIGKLPANAGYAISMTTWTGYDELWNMATDEQRKALPFPIEYMQSRKEMFEPHLTEYNYDRYAHAYGLNWVEEHIDINLYDLIKSTVIFDTKINYLTRYLDVIMLDDRLRPLFINLLGRFWPQMYDRLHEAFMPAFEDLLLSPMIPYDIKQELVLTILHPSMEVKKVISFVTAFSANPNGMSHKIITRATYKILPTLDSDDFSELNTILRQRAEYLDYAELSVETKGQ